MHIELTKSLKIGPPNAKYDLEGKFRESCTSMNLGNEGKIEEAMAAGNNKDDNDKDY